MRTRLTEKEKSYFVELLAPLRDSSPHPFVDPAEVDMYWNDTFNTDNGIMGWFQWTRPNDIDLNIDGQAAMDLMASTVAHELHHMWQYRTYKFLYLLALVPGIRQIALEYTAKRVELFVDEKLNLS